MANKVPAAPLPLPSARDMGRMGPKMQALTVRQRMFVQAMLDTGMSNHTRCAMLAGYTGTENTMRVTAHRLAHDEKVQAAIQEEARRRMNAGSIMAVGTLLNIAETPGHKDQLKAVLAVLDRSGLHAISESKTVHEHTFDEKAAISKIRELCKETGMDATKLLGNYGIVLDAEFEEVEPAAPAEITEREDGISQLGRVRPGYEGLEDLL